MPISRAEAPEPSAAADVDDPEALVVEEEPEEEDEEDAVDEAPLAVPVVVAAEPDVVAEAVAMVVLHKASDVSSAYSGHVERMLSRAALLAEYQL